MAFSQAKMPKEEVVKELNRGFELTTRLRVLLRQMPRDDLRREPAGILSLEVLRSLTAALCILESPGEAGRCSPPPRDHCGGTNSEGQIARGFAGKERHGRPARKNKRSRTELTETPYFDGHQWRKYGQKRIAGAKFTRSYYRCTYSDVDGCEATKQVQQEEGDENEPRMFRVKYNNEHTCRNRLKTRSLELIETTTRGSSQKQAWVSFGISDPRRCEQVRLLSFSSSSASASSASDQEQAAGAPNNSLLPSCWEWLASVGTSKPDGDPSLPNPNIDEAIKEEEPVSGGLEDEFSWI